MAERQRVVRLLVQETLVGGDNITIRHSIPLPALSPDLNHGVRPSPEPHEPNTGSFYLWRYGSLYSGVCEVIEPADCLLLFLEQDSKRIASLPSSF